MRWTALARRAGPESLLDLLAEIWVHIAPILERPRQHRLFDALGKMPNDVVHQAVSRIVVENLAHQGSSLPPVVVLGAQGVSGADHVAVGLPVHLGSPCGVGMRTAVR